MNADITGFELDLNSSDFQKLMVTNGQIVTPGKSECTFFSSGADKISIRFIYERHTLGRGKWHDSREHPIFASKYPQLQPNLLYQFHTYARPILISKNRHSYCI